MSLNSHVGEIIGKRISHVITNQRTEKLYCQLFLVFDDGTNMEFYGDIQNTKGICLSDFDTALSYAKGFSGEIKVYPENKKGGNS